MQASCLAQMSALLGSSLDYERALPRLVRLAVPVLADLCAIDLLMPDGTISRVACAHMDPTKEAGEARVQPELPQRGACRRPFAPVHSHGPGCGERPPGGGAKR